MILPRRAILLGSALVPTSAGTADPVPSVLWGLPFLGVLLSIALIPMLAPRFWHRRMGAVALGWSLALLLPMAVAWSPQAAVGAAWDGIMGEYLPFVALLLALYTAAGGILVRGVGGRPASNTALLAAGTAMAGVMGTTGAAMVMIHPLLASNAHRTRKTHLVVFFIALVANAGGATTPLGDPPLYLGYLHGVPFAWPLLHLTAPLLVLAVPLLLAFYLLDRRLAAADGAPPPARERFRLRGGVNIALIGAVVATVLGGSLWHGGAVVLFGLGLERARLAEVGVLLAITGVSVLVTPRAVRQANMFAWAPMREVAVLFAAVFITVGPVLAMLRAGFDGPLAPGLKLTVDGGGHPVPLAYFWLTGLLSAFLDNAPTYLVFFGLAGGDPAQLTGPLRGVLVATSTGAVFFGALTYIGNAPNLMLRSIAAHRGVRMPDFFGYMAWSCALLLPCFVLLSALFFR